MLPATIEIAQAIREVRGARVLLDEDLAPLYEVEVRVLNQAVKRNQARFPAEDFMFQLTQEEFELLRSQPVILKGGRGKHRKYTPYAFTEQGVAMLSGVLSSDRAIQVNIAIMRAFVQLRRIVAATAPLETIAGRLGTLETRVDATFQVVFDQLDELRHGGGASFTVHGPMVGNIVGMGSGVHVDAGRIPLGEVLRLVKAAPWDLDQAQRKEMEKHLRELELPRQDGRGGEVLKSLRSILENAAGGLLGEMAKAWLGAWL